jgi:hypothetical protein
MDQNKRTEAIEKLTSKGAIAPCPRCGRSSFSIVGEGIITIQENPNVISLGGPYIPTVIAICDNCGYISQHAKGPLGISIGGQK